MGAAGRVRILFGGAGLRLVRSFSPARYSHALHGRRGDHIFLSFCHQAITKIPWGHPLFDSNPICLHLHRDDDHPVGVLRERVRSSLRHNHGARIGRYGCGYVYWDDGGVGVDFILSAKLKLPTREYLLFWKTEINIPRTLIWRCSSDFGNYTF